MRDAPMTRDIAHDPYKPHTSDSVKGSNIVAARVIFLRTRIHLARLSIYALMVRLPMKSRATSLVIACLRPSSCHSDKAIMLSSAINGLNPARPLGGSGERCNVGEGDVRDAMLSREYMLLLPITQDSIAVAFCTESAVLANINYRTDGLTMARYILACVVFKKACSMRLPQVF